MNPNQDTDPSTPGAKRQSDPRTPSAGVPGATEVGSASASRNTTDPGLAPPGPMLPVPERPMGIVVPPAASVAGLNDSVDVLLEGISRELPDRPRATSHSDGHPTATYHAEHVIRTADRSPARNEPKVVIERAPRRSTSRVARYAGPIEDSDPREWTETTAIRRQSVTSRVVVALGAGVVVVVAIFVALQRTSNERAPLFVTGPAPASPATAAVIAPAPNVAATQAPGLPATQAAAPLAALPVAAVPAADPRSALVVLPPAGTAAPPPSIAAESLPAASSSASHPAAISARSNSANKPKPKAAASASKAPSSDLGEFKTAF